MVFSQDIFLSGHSNKNIAQCRSISQRHYAATMHRCINSFYGVYLTNDDICSQAFCTISNPFSAPSEPDNNNCFSCDYQVGRSHDTIPNRLPCTMVIIKNIFTLCFIYKHNRELECSIICTFFCASNACCCLFTGAEYVLQ